MRKFTAVLSLMLLFAATISAKSNILIAYFSWGGNTQALAEEWTFQGTLYYEW